MANDYRLGLAQAQLQNFGNYCSQPHYPDDAVEHARQRRAQLKVAIPAREEELEKLKHEAFLLDKMLGAVDASQT